MLAIMMLFGLGLPMLAAFVVSRIPMTNDGTRSAVLWVFVAPAAIGGVILGGVLGNALGLG